MKRSVSFILVTVMLFSALAGVLSAERIKGDIDGDSAVSNKDTVQLFRYVSEAAPYDENYDYNDDGYADNKDVVALFRDLSIGSEPVSGFPCKTHKFVFAGREVAAEYQIYSDVIDTYECSVCGYAYTETNTISNVHGDTAYLENELAGYINDLRESLGLNRLWHDNEFFNDFADLRAKELVTCFGHNRPNGEENTTTDGTYYVILENICGGGYDVYRIFQLFVHSNRHYRALIYEDAVGLAVGIYVREDGTPFTQVSIIASY